VPVSKSFLFNSLLLVAGSLARQNNVLTRQKLPIAEKSLRPHLLLCKPKEMAP